MKEYRVEITPALLECFGTGTLRAKFLDHNDSSDIWKIEDKRLTLVFIETSKKAREKNGGPEQIITNEYVFRLLLEDILFFQKNGFQIVTDVCER